MTHCPQKLRIGRIGYLNVLPIYYPLEHGLAGQNFTLVYGNPAELNTRMDAGELDVSSCSSIEYARHPEKYLLVPDIAIGSCGPVMSVLLVSQKPIGELSGESIVTTAQSHTSAALLRMLFRDYLHLDVTYTTGSVTNHIASGNAPVAALCIGDEALRLRSDSRYPYRLDLGEAWRQWTGLPFIFGVWIISREAVAKKAFTNDPAQLFLQAKQWGAENMETILSVAAKKGYLSKKELREYFETGLVFDLGEKEQQGLRLFFRRLAEAGEIPAEPALEFYNHR